MARNVVMPVPPQLSEAEAPPMGLKQKLEYTIKTITPVFGGGVDPGKHDAISVARVPAVRGHLRFWWRAVRGSQTGLAVSELRKREAAIWGSASVPSNVDVEVDIISRGNEVDWKHEERDREGRPKWRTDESRFPGYALFPFQEAAARDGRPAKARDWGLADVEFTVRVWAPTEFKDDVEAAVWAWVNFGGIGARTRRGCGALFCQACAPPQQTGVNEWVAKRFLQMYKGGIVQGTKPWPVLQAFPLLHQTQGAQETPTAAWVRAVGAMSRFRQKEGLGRNYGRGGRPGRSFWPEADSFRALAPDCGSPEHNEPITINPASPPLFPRALFGLPIVFQFKNSDPDFGGEIEMKPARGTGHEDEGPQLERMASPIILRPLAFGDGSRAMAMALLLRAPEPKAVILKNDNLPDAATGPWDAEHLKGPRIRSYTRSPIREYPNTQNVVDGFLKYLKAHEGFVSL